MPPFVDTQILLPAATIPRGGSASRDTFAKAIDEVLLELKKTGDRKNPFYNALENSHNLVPATRDKASQSDVSAEELRRFVESLNSPKLTGRGRQFLTRVSPFLGSLHSLMKICETLVQASPLGVSAAFTGARIVIELVTRMNTYAEIVAEAMDEIRVNIQCYNKFGDAYQSSLEVRSQIVKSYKNIVLFWYNVSQTLTQHNFRVAFRFILKPLEKDIKTALDGLKHDSDKVQKLAEAEEFTQSKGKREEDVGRS
ncbi:hypothetical protein VMCG_04010 [Cytospora schulzeri]|uniref:DUF7708 domain-containing protein n=1 Tax=Cytospora schulzeri TaxID=448051 RepID=A0A423WTC0_9PEZI|nr:hypothetical protein VMCG_04010 [Valsa malicola]